MPPLGKVVIGKGGGEIWGEERGFRVDVDSLQLRRRLDGRNLPDIHLHCLQPALAGGCARRLMDGTEVWGKLPLRGDGRVVVGEEGSHQCLLNFSLNVEVEFISI